MMTTENLDWQILAQQASEKQDPERLMELVRQLNSALENPDAKPSTPNPKDDKAVDGANA